MHLGSNQRGASIFIYPKALPLPFSPQTPQNSNPNHPLRPLPVPLRSLPAPLHPDIIALPHFQSPLSAPLVAFITFYPALITCSRDPSISCWLSLSKDTYHLFISVNHPSPVPEAVIWGEGSSMHCAEPVGGTFFPGFHRRKCLVFCYSKQSSPRRSSRKAKLNPVHRAGSGAATGR